MAAAFATVADYRLVYDSDETDERVGAFLARASRLVASELRSSGIDYSDPDEDFAGTLMDVTVSVAHRALGDGGGGADIPFGASQFSETNDFASASVQFANPYGDLFLIEAERRALGIGAGDACVLSPYG